MNLKAALARAHHLGMRVEKVSATGEVRVWPEEGAPPMTLNNRKKDAPRVLLKAIRRAEEKDR